MRDPLQRLYEAKLILLATVFTLLGILLLVLAHLAPAAGAWQWLVNLPIGELGGTLFTTYIVRAVLETGGPCSGMYPRF